jgi:hypothetical protein
MPEVIEERAPSADFGKVPGRTTGLICRDLMCKDKPVCKVHEQPRWWHEPRTVPISVLIALRASGAHAACPTAAPAAFRTLKAPTKASHDGESV